MIRRTSIISAIIFSLTIPAQICWAQTLRTSEPDSKSSQSAGETENTDASDAESTISIRGSEMLLPPTTRAWMSIPDADVLADAIEQTSFGKMLEDEKIAPFVDDLSAQIKGWLNEKNLQFGIKVDDIQNVDSGEICVAGILLDANPADPEQSSQSNPDHATILLVDISETREEAEALLEKVADSLRENGATHEQIEIGGLPISKWTLKKPRGLNRHLYAFHALVGDWLVTCDNENIVRDMVRRIHAEEVDPDNLANSEVFLSVQRRCDFAKTRPHLRWFIEPFGYVELAQAIARAKNPELAEEGNDFASIFRDQGFSAIQGVGGSVIIADEGRDLVHRTFIYAPPVEEAGEDRYMRAAAMLDFSNDLDKELAPPDWVPADSATYVSFTWDLNKALDRVGYIVEALGGKEGSWKKVMRELKDDANLKLDIPLLVRQLESRITVIAATEEPISESSERVVFGINIEGDEEIVKEHTRKLILRGTNDGEPFTVEHPDLGIEIWVMDTSADEELDIEVVDDPLADLLTDAPEEDVEEEIKKAKPLFERRVATVFDGVLLVGNDVEYIKKIVDRMASKPGRELAAASDYQRIDESLTALAEDFDGDSVIRHFGRLDSALQTNYEMMRQGRMGSSKTMLAQVLNQVFEPEMKGAPREQKIDATNMPEDYAADVAPYLGPNGMIVKGTADGWMILGCVLPKKNAVASVAKNESTESEDGVVKDNPRK